MTDAKYIGLDQATILVAVRESKAETNLQFNHVLRGSLHLTFEERNCAAWLHDPLKLYVAQVLVCEPRKNVPFKTRNKSDRINARELADLLYLN